MQIGATCARLEVPDGEIGAVLSRLEQQLQGCVAEVRRLIDDLRPPALDEAGLVEGIRRSVRTFEAANATAPAIAVDGCEDLDQLPAAVEVAAYRIAVEAVTNAVRHAGAKRCDVRISRDNALVVEVADDGVGLPPDHREGVGLVSMRERAEELGGTFSAVAANGSGTRIRAELPPAAS